MRASLRRVSTRDAQAAGEAVARHIRSSPAWRHAATVALYAGLPGEVATATLISAGWTEGRRVLLPRIAGEGRLVFAEHLPDVALVGGAFGVSEPAERAPVVDLAEADLILVPGVAFDRRGGRLGRGAGYYDRALAGIGLQAAPRAAADRGAGAPRTMGIAFDFQLVDRVPMDEEDVRMEAVVTPETLHAAGGRGD